MDWDRRAFVKFAVGAVGGLHASPPGLQTNGRRGHLDPKLELGA